MVVYNKNPKRSNEDVAAWSPEDEYEIVFDNGSGSYKPYFPAPEVLEILTCNFPAIRGRFSIRMVRGPFSSSGVDLHDYCKVFAGVDDIPPLSTCTLHTPFIKASPAHMCFGTPPSSDDQPGTCTWQAPGFSREGDIKLHASCCKVGGLVTDENPCSSQECTAVLKPRPYFITSWLRKAKVGAQHLLSGKDEECTARQWRTRMFDCVAVHRLGTPFSQRTRQAIKLIITTMADDQHLSDWTKYLDNLEGSLTLDSLVKGPSNMAEDKEVMSCILPFLTNAFPYIPMSIKLPKFVEVGVYDPAAGEMSGAKLEKLMDQYHQHLMQRVDYKDESYKTGFDGADGCPMEISIPSAIDEWVNYEAVAFSTKD